MPFSPFVEAKSPPVVTTFVSGSDTHEIDHLRQGVEISDPRMRLLGTLPKASAGTPDHQIPQTSFGQAKDFQDSTSFTDMTTLVPSTYVATGDAVMSYPLTQDNPSYAGLNDMDGVLEPLTIRAVARRDTIELPYSSHDVKGQVMDGNEDHLKRVDRIVDEYEFPAPADMDPFIDSAESFGTSPSSSIRLPGIASDVERKLRPFSESAPTLIETAGAGLLATHMLAMSDGVSGSHPQDPGYIGDDRVSSVKGFEHQSARRMSRSWTDSLAFGDRDAYGGRGFLATQDQAGGAYPTVARTGDADRPGNHAIRFDDNRHIVFNSGSNAIVNIGRNLRTDSGYLAAGYLTSTYVRTQTGGTTYPFIGQTRVVTPSNWPITTESNSVTIRAGVADSWVTFTQDDGPGPYDDSRIHLGNASSLFPGSAEDFFSDSTPESEYPGFSSRLDSKTQIKINLTPTEDHFLYRMSPERIMMLSGANTPEFTSGSTGFAYFNHVLRRWEDIGMHDPATGNRIPYDYCITTAPVGGTVNGFSATGTNNFPCQFSMSPQMAANGNGAASYIVSNNQARHWGYSTIGTPTNSNFAPFATMYHATRSQALVMSDYIRHPFLLERAVLNIQIVARKIHHVDSSGIRSDNDQRRDIDNYVFFMYKQSRIQDPKFGKDSKTDVSGSVRNLICSASFTFWNKLTVQVGNSYAGGLAIPSAEMTEWPLHGPAFEHDWNEVVNSVAPNHTIPDHDFVGIYTASLTIPIKMAVAPVQFHGASSFPAQERVGGADVQKIVKFQNAWVGATSQAPFMELSTGFTGKSGVSSSVDTYDSGIAGLYTGKHRIFDPGFGATGISRTIVADGRSFRSLGGGSPNRPTSNDTFSIYSVSGNIQSTVAPYVLLPTDELIFGFDAGISQFRNGASLGLTGSFLKILAQNASITLFGSLIRNGVEYHNTLNQNLTSQAVHEAIYSDDIVDQFEVEPRAVFSGSYIDSLISGNLTPGGGRGIVASAAALPENNNIRDSGSLFRGFVAHNLSERYYDTIMPNLVKYLSSTNRVSSYTSLDSGQHIIMLDPPRFFAESGTYRMPYPYNNTFERDDLKSGFVKLITNSAAGSTITGEALRRALFKIGDKINRVDTAGAANPHADDGAMAFRYGIYNTNPVNTRVVYRYNRYGQFRDMLEQRPDSKFQVTAMPEFGIANKTQQSPIFVRFDPSGSGDSSNVSVEATSSLPYFDGTVRNRASS